MMAAGLYAPQGVELVLEGTDPIINQGNNCASNYYSALDCKLSKSPLETTTNKTIQRVRRKQVRDANINERDTGKQYTELFEISCHSLQT